MRSRGLVSLMWWRLSPPLNESPFLKSQAAYDISEQSSTTKMKPKSLIHDTESFFFRDSIDFGRAEGVTRCPSITWLFFSFREYSAGQFNATRLRRICLVHAGFSGTERKHSVLRVGRGLVSLDAGKHSHPHRTAPFIPSKCAFPSTNCIPPAIFPPSFSLSSSTSLPLS